MARRDEYRSERGKRANNSQIRDQAPPRLRYERFHEHNQHAESAGHQDRRQAEDVFHSGDLRGGLHLGLARLSPGRVRRDKGA